MALKEEFESQGNWLFVRRSYIPAVVLLACILGMYNYSYPQGNPEYAQAWFAICVGVSFLGGLFRCFVIGFAAKNTSGRNTSVGQVADTVNSTGMYSTVRHPLYTGNFIMWLGVLMYPMSMSVLIFGILFYWLYYERIMYAEEQFMTNKFGDKYLTWASSVPAFIPKLQNWTKPENGFSIKHVIKREYLGFYAPLFCIALLASIGYYRIHDQWGYDQTTLGFFVVGTALFILIRIVVKFTKILEVETR